MGQGPREPIGFSFELHPPLFLIVFIVFCGIAFLCVRKKNLKPNKLFFISALIFYGLSVYKLVFLPFTIKFNDDSYQNIPFEYYYQLVPFESITSYFSYGNYIQFFGNLVLLLPLPILLGLIKGKSMSFMKNLILITIVTLFIELTQLLINILTEFPNKIADIDDFILNISGGIIGLFIIKWYFLYFKKSK